LVHISAFLAVSQQPHGVLRVAKVSAASVPASSEGVVKFILRGCLLRSGKGIAGPH
jgi:hypothetical protein